MTYNPDIHHHDHVEKPLLNQHAGLKWEIIDLDSKQHLDDRFPRIFAETF